MPSSSQPRRPAPLLLGTLIAWTAITSSARAQTTGTWNVDADGVWSNASNWLGNTIADGAGGTANFGFNITSTRTVTLDSDRTIGELIFSDGGAAGSAWVLNGSSSSRVLTLTNSGGPKITTTSDALISVVLAGSQGLTKDGGGTLVLTGTNTYLGNTTIKAGTLQIGNGGASGTISGTIVNSGQLIFNRSNSFTLSGNVIGTGSLVQAGSGTLILSAINSYSGGTTISAGTLQVEGPGGGITGNITNNSLLILNGGVLPLDGSITGTGAIAKIGGGTTMLTGSNGFTGVVSIQNGTLVITSSRSLGNGSLIALGSGLTAGVLSLSIATGSSYILTRDITLNGSGGGAILNNSPTLTTAVTGSINITGSNNTAITLGGANQGLNAVQSLIANSVSGTTVGITKTGTGTWIVANSANSFTGGVTVHNGVLREGSAGALNRADNNIRFSNNSSTTAVLETAGTLTSSIGVGPGQVQWATDADGGFSAFGGPLNIVFNNDAQTSLTWGMTPGFINGAGSFILGSSSATDVVTIYNPIDLDGGSRTFRVNDNITTTADIAVLAGVISNGGLRKSGLGTLVLTGDNTYTGTTVINTSGGILQIGLGGTSGRINGNISNAESLVINRAGVFDYGGAISGAGDITKTGSGTMILRGNSVLSGTVYVLAGGLEFNGGVFSTTSSPIWVGSAAVDIKGNATVTSKRLFVAHGSNTQGTVNIDAATLNVLGGVVIGDDGSASLTVQNGGSLLSRGATLGQSIGTFGSATVSGNGSRWIDTGMTIGFTGTGSLNILAGGSVQSGFLDIGGPYPNGSSVNVDGATSLLSVTDDLKVGANGRGQLNITNGANVISSGGYLAYANGSTGTALIDGAGSSWLTTLMYGGWNGTGALTVRNGGSVESVVFVVGFDDHCSLTVSSGGIVQASGAVVGSQVNSTGTAMISGIGSQWIMTGALTIGLSGRGSLSVLDGAVISSSVGYVGFRPSSSGTLTINGPESQWTISTALFLGGSSTSGGGAGLLTVTGGGSVIVGGMTMIYGTSSINVGIGGMFSTGALAGRSTVTDNGLLVISGSGSTTYSGVITGGGSVLKTGDGIQTFIGNNVYSGGTTILGGGIQIGDGSTAGGILGNIVDNGLLIFNRGNAYTFDGIISGTGDVTKTGAGSLILTSAGTFSGVTSILSGTLQLAHNAALQNSTAVIAVNQGLTFSSGISSPTLGGLSGTGSVTLINAAGAAINLNVGSNNLSTTYGGVLSGTGTVTKLGAGTLAFGGLNTYTGGTTVSAGTLEILTDGGIKLDGNVFVAAGATFRVDAGASLFGAGAVTGSGTFINNGTIASDYTAEDGAVLKGNGAIQGSVTINAGATISPGNSVGTLTVGNLTLNSSTVDPSIAIFEFRNAIGTLPGTDWDYLDVSVGTLTINATQAAPMMLRIDSWLANNTGHGGNDFDPLTPYHWKWIEAANIILFGSDLIPDRFVIDDDMAGAGVFGGGNPFVRPGSSYFSVSRSGNTLYIDYTPDLTAVPEPGSLVLAGAAGVGLFLRRRRAKSVRATS